MPTALKAGAAQRELARLADAATATILRGYFRTEKGGYAEGDRFRGVKVPQVRAIAKRYRTLSLPEIRRLLRSKWHEDRLLGLIILVDQAQRADPETARQIADFYFHERETVNNWDLVDTSAPAILGPFVSEFQKRIDTMSRSRDVWDRRISILSHYHDIRAGRTDRFYRFAPRFLDDPHDLVHKAVGWMLREAGKHDAARLTAFVERHGPRMPRTMLRYAIEKLPEAERRRLLA